METTDKPLRVALYLRVSTDEQTVRNQEAELREAVAGRGWQVVQVYRDEGVSGAKRSDQRPGLKAALDDAVRGRYDVLAAWAVDRLGRSLQDLVATLRTLHEAGRDLFLLRQALDTRTSAGRAMFGMLGVFAQFERDILRERVRSGLARAVREGKRLGRRPVSVETERKVRALRRAGHGICKIARLAGCGVGTVQRIVSTS